MFDTTPRRRSLLVAGASAALLALAFGAASAASADDERDRREDRGKERVAKVELLTPRPGDRAGRLNRAFVVDTKTTFRLPLEQTGFTSEQLTGPATHNNVPPFPGLFSRGQDDRFRGLIVVVSTDSVRGSNVANLFNLTAVTDRREHSSEVQSSWIVGAPQFGTGRSTVYAAIAADKNGDGSHNDAPPTVPDSDGDGDVDDHDIREFGVASNVARVRFSINPAP
ncbi:MAG: hypothetical protein ABR583_00740 [Gaiellaceae bacterium]